MPGRIPPACRRHWRRRGSSTGIAGSLAPTAELRQLQYREDDRVGVGKRSRVELAAEYRRRYLREILDQVDLRPIVEAIAPADGAPALAVRRGRSRGLPRSLIAERLEAEFRVSVEHLRPSPL